MADPITKLVDLQAVVKDTKNIYALLTKINKKLDDFETRLKALET